MELKVADAVDKVYKWYHKDCEPREVTEGGYELFDRPVADGARAEGRKTRIDR